MNTKAIAKRQDNAVAAPQQQRHLTLKELLLSPMAQQKIRENAVASVDPMQEMKGIETPDGTVTCAADRRGVRSVRVPRAWDHTEETEE